MSAGEDPLRFAVLQDRGQIHAARRSLLARGLAEPVGRRGRLARRVPALARWLDPGAPFRPDPVKSWDVARMLDALERRLAPADPVVDLGCFASAILPALHRTGHRGLAGIDLDPRTVQLPGAGAVDYRVGDLTATPWPDGAFAAATSVSVLEHGVDDERLLAEIRRLLRPGGVFLFSVDFWPDKVDTSDVRLFGLPWRIFSAQEVEALVERAAAHDLRPVADPAAALRDVRERAISFEGRGYTFLAGALVRG